MLNIYNNSFTRKSIADRPIISPIYDNKSQFYLYEPYSLYFIYKDKLSVKRKIKIFIPSNFIFDGASIPRFFWRVVGFPLSPKFIVAALIHDVLFGKIDNRVKIWEEGKLLKSDEAEHLFDQKNCDIVFRGILYEEKNSGWKVRSMYRALRVAGRFCFRKSDNMFYKD
tara:strand:- start:241 stop:744 length:504 start_codon:yes stop_codon:yes gene_type:complete